MTDPGESASPRLAARVRALASSVLDLLYTRALLVGTDLELQIERLQTLALLSLAALLLFALALIFASLLVVAAFWDTYRLTALAAVAALYLVAGILCAQRARKWLREGPHPFAATIEELRRDVSRLRS